MNEIALPLALEVAARHATCETGRPGCQVQSVPCWGSSVEHTEDPVVLAGSTCGHKINLDNPRMEASFVGLWGTKTPPAYAPLPEAAVGSLLPAYIAIGIGCGLLVLALA